MSDVSLRVPAPKTIAELVRLSLEDGKKLFETEREKYRPYYEDWHQGAERIVAGRLEQNQCSLCLAGMVMAGRLGIDWSEDANPADVLSDRWRVYLGVVENVRSQNWDHAYSAFYFSFEKVELHWMVQKEARDEMLKSVRGPKVEVWDHEFAGWSQWLKFARQVKAALPEISRWEQELLEKFKASEASKTGE